MSLFHLFIDIDPIINIVIVIFIAIFGLCFGSFMNVVIYRVPNNMSLIKPASHCPNCNHPIKWYENIPVFSYLFLGGKCSSCHKPISVRYLIVELLTAALCVLMYVRFQLDFKTLLGCVMVMLVIGLSFIDLDYLIIPDRFNISLAVLGLISIIFNDTFIFKNDWFTVTWLDKLIGLVIGLVAMLVIGLVERLVKKEVMGGGDIKLIIALGLILGWQLLFFTVFFGSIIALIVQIILMISKKNREDYVVPFGPYLGFGALIAYLWGMDLLNLYYVAVIK